jgi:hypothetical protein
MRAVDDPRAALPTTRMSDGIDQLGEEVYYQSPSATHARIMVEREGITAVERQGITALGGIEHGETSS